MSCSAFTCEINVYSRRFKDPSPNASAVGVASFRDPLPLVHTLGAIFALLLRSVSFDKLVVNGNWASISSMPDADDISRDPSISAIPLLLSADEKAKRLSNP